MTSQHSQAGGEHTVPCTSYGNKFTIKRLDKFSAKCFFLQISLQPVYRSELIQIILLSDAVGI